VLRTIAGRDPMDSLRRKFGAGLCGGTGEAGSRAEGRSGETYFGSGLDLEVRAAVEAAIQKLAELGCEVVPVSAAA